MSSKFRIYNIYKCTYTYLVKVTQSVEGLYFNSPLAYTILFTTKTGLNRGQFCPPTTARNIGVEKEGRGCY